MSEEFIRDRFTQGLRDSQLSETLQNDPNLILEKVKNIVLQSQYIKKQEILLRSNFEEESTVDTTDIGRKISQDAQKPNLPRPVQVQRDPERAIANME